MNKKDKNADIKNKKKGINKKRILIIFLLIIAILGVIFAKRVYDLNGNWIAVLMGHNRQTIEKLGQINVLLMGESQELSDTMIVCSYNPQKQKASLISIPRDTFAGVNINDAKPSDKLNSIYRGGKTPEKTLEAINNITGLDIKYYLLIDTKALVELVDAIGGIEFNVPIDMEYKDKSQNLTINLKAGKQKLTGSQVEQVVRFRHNSDGSTYPAEYGIEDYRKNENTKRIDTNCCKRLSKYN